MPGGVRPDSRLSKIVYSILKRPKTLQQNDKNISVKVVKGWNRENPPANQDVTG